MILEKFHVKYIKNLMKKFLMESLKKYQIIIEGTSGRVSGEIFEDSPENVRVKSMKKLLKSLQEFSKINLLIIKR